MVIVAGPGLDPGPFAREGVEVLAFMPDLHRHLAACDIARVQGGLTTGMELIAATAPPLRGATADGLRLRDARRQRRGEGLEVKPLECSAHQSTVAEIQPVDVEVGGGQVNAGLSDGIVAEGGFPRHSPKMPGG